MTERGGKRPQRLRGGGGGADRLAGQRAPMSLRLVTTRYGPSTRPLNLNVAQGAARSRVRRRREDWNDWVRVPDVRKRVPGPMEQALKMWCPVLDDDGSSQWEDISDDGLSLPHSPERSRQPSLQHNPHPGLGPQIAYDPQINVSLPARLPRSPRHSWESRPSISSLQSVLEEDEGEASEATFDTGADGDVSSPGSAFESTLEFVSPSSSISLGGRSTTPTPTANVPFMARPPIMSCEKPSPALETYEARPSYSSAEPAFTSERSVAHIDSPVFGHTMRLEPISASLQLAGRSPEDTPKALSPMTVVPSLPLRSPSLRSPSLRSPSLRSPSLGSPSPRPTPLSLAPPSPPRRPLRDTFEIAPTPSPSLLGMSENPSPNLNTSPRNPPPAKLTGLGVFVPATSPYAASFSFPPVSPAPTPTSTPTSSEFPNIPSHALLSDSLASLSLNHSLHSLSLHGLPTTPPNNLLADLDAMTLTFGSHRSLFSYHSVGSMAGLAGRNEFLNDLDVVSLPETEVFDDADTFGRRSPVEHMGVRQYYQASPRLPELSMGGYMAEAQYASTEDHNTSVTHADEVTTSYTDEATMPYAHEETMSCTDEATVLYTDEASISYTDANATFVAEPDSEQAETDFETEAISSPSDTDTDSEPPSPSLPSSYLGVAMSLTSRPPTFVPRVPPTTRSHSRVVQTLRSIQSIGSLRPAKSLQSLRSKLGRRPEGNAGMRTSASHPSQLHPPRGIITASQVKLHAQAPLPARTPRRYVGGPGSPNPSVVLLHTKPVKRSPLIPGVGAKVAPKKPGTPRTPQVACPSPGQGRGRTDTIVSTWAPSRRGL